MKRTRPQASWESLSLKELAEQQGVTPVEQLDDVSSLWPVDDDPDELLRFILQERRAEDARAADANRKRYRMEGGRRSILE